MALDFEALGIRVDTSGVATGAADLDKLTAAAQRTEQATDKLAPSAKGASQGIRELGSAGSASAPAINSSASALNAATISARQYSQAMRLLPPQVAGIGRALSILAPNITPVTLALGGLATVAVGIAKAYYDVQKESFEAQKAIILSGNAAGVTGLQFSKMTKDIDGVVGTQREAAAVLGQLISTNRVASQNLQQFATVAQSLKRTAGQPVEETVKAFAELGRKPVEASIKLNEQFNYLTKSTYDQIKALEDQGKTFEAGEIAQKAYAEAMQQRVDKLDTQLGTLQRAARSTGEFFAEMWDSILNIGREQPLDKQLDALEKRIRQLNDLQSRFTEDKVGGLFTDRQRQLDGLLKSRDAILALLEADKKESQAAADRKKQLDAQIATEKEATKVTAARRAEMEQSAKLKFAADISGLQRSLQSSLSGYAAYTAQLEALRSADMVSDEEYFAAKRALVEKDSEVRTRALRGEIQRIASESARLDAARKQVASDSTLSESERMRAEAPLTREIASNAEKIRETEAKIVEVLKDASSQYGVINLQQQNRVDQTETALKQARASAQAYLEITQLQRQRDLASMGLGDRQRQFNSGLDDIDDRFAEQRRRLEDRLARKDIKKDQYDQELAIAREFREKDRADYQKYWADLDRMQGSYFVGASDAWNNYLDNARNVSEQISSVFARALNGMEDGLIQFVQTGKLDFKSLANSIIADLLRIQLRAAAAQLFGGSEGGGFNWAGLIGGLFGALGGGGSSAVQEIPMSSLPKKLATGAARIPRDNFPALLHKDEAVLPKWMNPWAGGRGFGQNTTIQIGGSTIYAEAGTNVAQLKAVLDQRDAELEARIANNFYRGRWAAANA